MRVRGPNPGRSHGSADTLPLRHPTNSFKSIHMQHTMAHIVQMETFSALLTICAGNSPVTGEFPAQRPVMRSFDVFFDLSLNKRLSEQSWGWWFEPLSRPLWRHCNRQWTARYLERDLYQICVHVSCSHVVVLFSLGYISITELIYASYLSIRVDPVPNGVILKDIDKIVWDHSTIKPI